MIKNGFTLVELLVVVAVFSILAVLATQSLSLSLKGSRKSESIANVREELSRAMSVMERQIRNATELENCTSSTLTYTDQYYNTGETFDCVDTGTDAYIASSSARLTSPKVRITNCAAVFVCTIPAGDSPPPFVEITLTAVDSGASGIEGAEVTNTTRINLRTY